MATVGCATPLFAANRSLRVGCTLDTSGPEKANGSALHSGASAYFAALNKAGGVGGLFVELVLSDDQFKPELSKTHALAFDADRSIIAMLHPLGTRQTAVVMDAVQGMPVVGPNTGTASLRARTSANVFWVRANYDQEIDKLVKLATASGMRSVALVHPNDALGQSLLAAFKTATSKYEIPVTVIATTPNTISAEVDSAALQIAKAAPQMVVMGLASAAPNFVRAVRAAGYPSGIYGLSIGASAGNIGLLGDASRGLGFSIVVPSPFAVKHEIVRRYQVDMQVAGSTEYSLPSLEGYINARVLTEGLRRAGMAPTRESLLTALEGIDALDLGGMRLSFGKSRHEGGSFVDIAEVGPGGRLVS